MSKFKIGDVVQIVNPRNRYHRAYGVVEDIHIDAYTVGHASGFPVPFRVSEDDLVFVSSGYGTQIRKIKECNDILVPKIKNVILNDPAVIVIWGDGTKTVVKAQGEEFDPEKGLAMAISKKALGNKHSYYGVFLKNIPGLKKKGAK